jgi:hypothetical protein
LPYWGGARGVDVGARDERCSRTVQTTEDVVSDAAVYVKWGSPVVGRESKSIEVFKEALGVWNRLQKEGLISAHREYFATNGDRDRFRGFVVIEGSVAQLRSMIDGDEWRNLLIKVTSVATNVEVVHCASGAEIPKLLEEVAAVRKQLGVST